MLTRMPILNSKLMYTWRTILIVFQEEVHQNPLRNRGLAAGENAWKSKRSLDNLLVPLNYGTVKNVLLKKRLCVILLVTHCFPLDTYLCSPNQVLTGLFLWEWFWAFKSNHLLFFLATAEGKYYITRPSSFSLQGAARLQDVTDLK